MKIPVAHQIEEVERELRMRASAYPRMVAARKMRQGEADMHVNRMEAALRTLRWLEKNEDAIKSGRPVEGEAE